MCLNIFWQTLKAVYRICYVPRQHCVWCLQITRSSPPIAQSRQTQPTSSSSRVITLAVTRSQFTPQPLARPSSQLVVVAPSSQRARELVRSRFAARTRSPAQGTWPACTLTAPIGLMTQSCDVSHRLRSTPCVLHRRAYVLIVSCILVKVLLRGHTGATLSTIVCWHVRGHSLVCGYRRVCSCHNLIMRT